MFFVWLVDPRAAAHVPDDALEAIGLFNKRLLGGAPCL
jgi:hypothetical protein